MIRGRLRRHPGEGKPRGGDEVIEIDPAQLSGIFSVPGWLRNIGVMAWLLVGITLLICGLVWLGALTQVITIPVIVAGIVAVVGSPVVGWLHRRRVPRALGALLLMLAVVLAGAGLGVLVVSGIEGQAGSIGAHLDDAKDEIAGWLEDTGLGQSDADQAKQDLGRGAAGGVSALLNGVIGGLEALSSLAFFLAMTILSLFFLLKDGPTIRAWTESHMGVPAPVARIVTQRTIGSMRGYFLGTTLVALFSAVVVGIGSLIIGAPLIGTIVAVTFIAGYIPYLGAWTAAIFAVLLTLGADGIAAASAMAFLQLLANGPLQQIVQPFAMGTALGIHPLAVLIVTIAGGALFGAVGLIISAPLVAAAVRISADLARAREAERQAELEIDDPPNPGAPSPSSV
ncbi:MAG TPA: AI-2E family transporter [Solirubrobacterales bacterium]|nr:AI-2E family transporter [Solirubrobacterales bacterium]